MGGICKEVWIWDFLIKFSFGWLQNLNSGTFGWMLENSLHCAFIVAYNGINDKEAIIECILYHLQNYRSLHTLWDSLEVIWSLMSFWFFFFLLWGITLKVGLVIEDHSNDPLASPKNDEVMPARGVISPTRWSLLPAHIIYNGKFNLVLIFSLYDRAHQSTYDRFFCSSVYFISSWRASSISKSLTSRSSVPAYASIFVNYYFSNTCLDRFSIAKSFFGSLPPPPMGCITKTHCKLILYHLIAA